MAGLKQNSVLLLSLAFCACALASSGVLHAADNWPQFRGADSKGVAEDNPSLPDTWSKTENIAWKTAIPGLGWSSPIVWGDKIFVTTAVSEGEVETPQKGLYFKGERPTPEVVHHWKVFCLDLKSGAILWEKEAAKGVPPQSHHLKNTFASETPVTDGERVYAYFGNLGVFAYDMNGNEVWSKKFDPVRTRYGWGTAASPALYKDRLYIVNDNDDKSYLLALDKETGNQIWRADRADEKSNWATPFIWENEKRTEIVTPGTGAIRSYDLDGKLLWSMKGMSSITIMTPFSKFGLLYVSSGYVQDKRKPVFAIKPGATGDITLDADKNSSEFVSWAQKDAGPYNPSPIIYGDLFYVLLDRGFITCYDAKTGEEVYGKQRIGEGSNAFTSSPWAYNGKVFCLSEDGDTFVFEAGREPKAPIRKNSLDELCMATPAIVQGNLILRTSSNLYCIRNGAKTLGKTSASN